MRRAPDTHRRESTRWPHPLHKGRGGVVHSALERLPNKILAAEHRMKLPDEQTIAAELERTRGPGEAHRLRPGAIREETQASGLGSEAVTPHAGSSHRADICRGRCDCRGPASSARRSYLFSTHGPGNVTSV